MAASSPPGSDTGSNNLDPKILCEETAEEDGSTSEASQAETAPNMFAPPSHRELAKPPPADASAKINPNDPTTDEVERFDDHTYQKPELPLQPKAPQRSNLIPLSYVAARSNQQSDQTSLMRSNDASPLVSERSSSPRKPPAVAPTPHLSVVASNKSIATKCCPDGHPNNPDVRVCRICGVAFRPTTKVDQMTPGSIFRLIFEDGTAIEIADDIIVGRGPINDDVVDTLTVDDAQVSRQHFVLEAQGWQLVIKDCGSMNGTFLSRRGKRGRVRVSPDAAIPVQAGDTVHFGSRQALLVDIGPA